jgi:heptosyltransferase II
LPRFLVIQTASIGDVILATAVIEKLHQHFPDATIDFMVKKGNETLFKGHPFLNNLVVWDKSGSKYLNLYRMMVEVRKTRYDYVINLQRFAATGLITVFSKARFTAGFQKNPFSRWFTFRAEHHISIEKNIHEIARNQAVIALFTDGVPARPRLYPSADDFRSVEKYQVGTYLCIAPASLWFTKQLPADQWVSLIKEIPETTNILLLGSKSDHELCESIRNESRSVRCQNLAGKLSLLQSAALMKGAEMNYVNDSSPMHLASAVNAGTTAVFCSTVPQFGFGPLSDHATVIETTEKLPCRPCGLHGHKICPETHFACATSISTKQLISTLHL